MYKFKQTKRKKKTLFKCTTDGANKCKNGVTIETRFSIKSTVVNDNSKPHLLYINQTDTSTSNG